MREYQKGDKRDGRKRDKGKQRYPPAKAFRDFGLPVFCGAGFGICGRLGVRFLFRYGIGFGVGFGVRLWFRF